MFLNKFLKYSISIAIIASFFIISSNLTLALVPNIYHNSNSTNNDNSAIELQTKNYSLPTTSYQLPTNIELPCPDSASVSVIPELIGNPVEKLPCLATFKIESPTELTDADIENILFYQELFKTVLSKIPYHLWKSLDDVTFSFETDIPRGSANSHKIILRITKTNENEFTSVLIHELGHVADLGAFKGNPDSSNSVFLDGSSPIYSDDLSVKFYSSYWEDSTTIISDKNNDSNFISGYSHTDPFEHFAETFLAYVLHGELLKSRNIDQYNFMRDEIFEGYIYDDFSDEDTQTNTPYDATKLKFDLNKFLES